MTTPGTLFLVATPIGNLADITLRALETLHQVDLIAAEDTRHSNRLLHHYGIKTPVISLHNYNEHNRTKFISTQLQEGKKIALLSDAGTPLISDPGYHLVKTATQNGVRIIPLPGACAAITALSVSALPTTKFIFEGFLPAKPQQQLHHLKKLAAETRTLIFYEAPHRLLTTIAHMVTIFDATRPATLAKELTKTFETIYHNTLKEIYSWLQQEPERQKGEFVIIVQGAPSSSTTLDPKTLEALTLLAQSVPPRKAAAIVARLTGANKNLLYQQLLHQKN